MHSWLIGQNPCAQSIADNELIVVHFFLSTRRPVHTPNTRGFPSSKKMLRIVYYSG
jgi:hypothetical protein